MRKIKLNLDKNKKYILACSYGPDSMALLDACLKANINVSVAHVNYHHREESDYEQKALMKYCKDRKLEISVLDLRRIKPEGNFEAWARKIRYEFFAKTLNERNADAVLVAHHQDDLLETYLMQKKRGNIVKNYGIAKQTKIFNVDILRPLLDYKKSELLEYCNENNVPYSIDKTNLTDELERNKIRHQIIEKLTDNERNKLLEEIKNKKTVQCNFKPEICVDKFLDFSYEKTVVFLDKFFELHAEHKNISKKHYLTIQKTLKSEKANIEIKLTNFLSIFKCYNTLYFIDKTKLISYNIILEKPGEFSEYIFEGEFAVNDERGIKKEDYPIVIKNVRPEDRYKIKNYQSSVRRMLIDWKMPLFLRKIWPGVYNSKNELIYIPRYKEKFTENHKTKFLIKIKDIVG